MMMAARPSQAAALLLLLLAAQPDLARCFTQPLALFPTKHTYASTHARTTNTKPSLPRDHFTLAQPNAGALRAFPSGQDHKGMPIFWPTSATRTALHAWPKNRDPKGMPPDYPLAFARICFTIAATVLTWYAHTSGRCGPVVASAAVTLVSSLTAPGLGQAAMTGTFAGMSGIGLVPSWQAAVGLGAATSLLFEAFIHYWNLFLGLGGRLGFLSFLAINTVAALQRISPHLAATSLAAVRTPVVLPMVLGAVGSVATIALREGNDEAPAADPIRAAAIIGVVAGLLVGVVPAYTDFGAACVYGGAFTGMSLPSRLLYGVIPGKKPPAHTEEGRAAQAVEMRPPSVLGTFAAAGAFGGFVHWLTLHFGWWAVPAGWGGKLGASSFVGVLAVRGLAKLLGVKAVKAS